MPQLLNTPALVNQLMNLWHIAVCVSWEGQYLRGVKA